MADELDVAKSKKPATSKNPRSAARQERGYVAVAGMAAFGNASATAP
jgi:hypothetical protein